MFPKALEAVANGLETRGLASNVFRFNWIILLLSIAMLGVCSRITGRKNYLKPSAEYLLNFFWN